MISFVTRIRFVFCICLPVSVLLLAGPGCAAQPRHSAGISGTGYSVQVGAFADVMNAERLSARLQEKGIDAFYFKKDNGVYAVRFGNYESRVGARKEAARLVTENIISDYFIASPADAYFAKAKGPEPHSGSLPAARKGEERDMGAIAARTAERFVGIPYQWGGNNVVEGMDCSGFVRAVFNLCGVNIPRNSKEQYKVGERVGREYLRDGDLVFFGSSEDSISHVGIYVGSNRFVHAPRRGDEIRTTSLDDPYFTRKYIGARRYF